MQRLSPIAAVGWTIASIVKVLVLLVVELVATMAAYTYLNLYHIETFGWLVRLSRSVLEIMSSQLEFWLRGKTDTVYATLFGELGPKSILLLLLGLVIAALVRLLASLLSWMLSPRDTVDLGRSTFRRRDA